MPEYNPDNYTSTQIGEDYYEWVNQYLDGGALSDLQQPILPPDLYSMGSEEEWSANQPGYEFWGNLVSPWIESEDFSSWWVDYGNTFAADYELGPGSLDRVQRIGDISKNQLIDATNLNINAATTQGGITGFSGSGTQQNILDDLWSNYVTQANTVNLQTQQSTSDIYSEQGQSILDTLQQLGEGGAFTEYESDSDMFTDTDCTCYSSVVDSSGNTVTAYAVPGSSNCMVPVNDLAGNPTGDFNEQSGCS